MKFVCALLVAMTATAGLAFQPVPKESAKALRITRGKSFDKGVVFVNGKYLAPPYVVERWGTGLRINKVPVTGQVIEWDEFLKTQSGAKAIRDESVSETAPSPSAAPAPAAPAPAADSEDSDESSLDDLFDDDPKPKKKKKSSARPSSASAAAKPAARPKPAVTYSIEGEFVPNDASKALLARINAARTDVDRALRRGGFIFFGDRYSQVSGDARTLARLLDELPELLQHSSDFQSFYAGMRAAHFVYLHEAVCADLFANRYDYPQLKQLRRNIKSARELEKALNGLSQPTF